MGPGNSKMNELTIIQTTQVNCFYCFFLVVNLILKFNIKLFRVYLPTYKKNLAINFMIVGLLLGLMHGITAQGQLIGKRW